MQQDIKVSEEHVYCVLDTETGNRVGQFYSRAKDAVSKAKQLNAWYPEKPYIAVKFKLSNVEEIK